MHGRPGMHECGQGDTREGILEHIKNIESTTSQQSRVGFSLRRVFSTAIFLRAVANRQA
jgi:hypothetical protein